jgi:hypothetical protein
LETQKIEDEVFNTFVAKQHLSLEPFNEKHLHVYFETICKIAENNLNNAAQISPFAYQLKTQRLRQTLEDHPDIVAFYERMHSLLEEYRKENNL